MNVGNVTPLDGKKKLMYKVIMESTQMTKGLHMQGEFLSLSLSLSESDSWCYCPTFATCKNSVLLSNFGGLLEIYVLSLNLGGVGILISCFRRLLVFIVGTVRIYLCGLFEFLVVLFMES